MLVPLVAIGSIMLIGAINYIGPRKAGTFALIVALATLFLTLIIGVFAVPHLATGWHNIVSQRQVPGTSAVKWDNLVKVILALSGVEAIANMTGVMKLNPGSTAGKPQVSRTANRAIFIVALEVVLAH